MPKGGSAMGDLVVLKIKDVKQKYFVVSVG